jgi:predicted nucleotide-binding protein
MEKYNIFKGLTAFLIDGVTTSGGWSDECGNHKEDNPLNTAEVLSGLILSRHHLLSKKLNDKFDATIDKAIDYLIKTQLESGGWATGSAYVDPEKRKQANGNIASTCWSIIAISLYSDKYENGSLKTIDAIKKSLEYLEIREENGMWSYFPDATEVHNLLATSYALLSLSYITLSELLMQKLGRTEKLVITNMITESIDILLNCKESYSAMNKENYMPIVFIFIALGNLKKCYRHINSLSNLKTHLFTLIQKFPEDIVAHKYAEAQYVQKEAKYPRYFHHYMPIWIIIANTLSDSNINNFDAALTEVFSNIDNEYKGASYEIDNKRYTWSTALTLMGLSLLFDDCPFAIHKYTMRKNQSVKEMDNSDNNGIEINKKMEIKKKMEVNKKKVFVVHGRDKERLNSVLSFLAEIGLEPLTWEEAVKLTGNPSSHTSEIIHVGINYAQATIVLFTGDDEVMLRECYWDSKTKMEDKTKKLQSRPNVIFEAGLSFGLSDEKTIFVKMGEHKEFSDIDGINFISFDNSKSSKVALKSRLEIAGCEVNDKY